MGKTTVFILVIIANKAALPLTTYVEEPGIIDGGEWSAAERADKLDHFTAMDAVDHTINGSEFVSIHSYASRCPDVKELAVAGSRRKRTMHRVIHDVRFQARSSIVADRDALQRKNISHHTTRATIHLVVKLRSQSPLELVQRGVELGNKLLLEKALKLLLECRVDQITVIVRTKGPEINGSDELHAACRSIGLSGPKPS